MMLYFSALPVVQAREQWSLTLPNKLNIAFDFYYFLCFTILLYIPRENPKVTTNFFFGILLFIICCRPDSHIICGLSLSSVFPQLYGHMIHQRKKIIGGAKTKTE